MNKFLSALLLIFSLCCISAAEKQQPGTEAYQKALEFLEEEDLGAALPLLREAADAGHPDAIVQLVYVLPELDEKTKVELLLKAAEKGNAFAQFYLGNFYFMNKEPVKAAEFYRLAMLADHPNAGLMFGICCLQGIGIKKDLAAAQKAFEVDIAKGNADAMNFCAVMLCRQGKFEEGIALLEKAADLNHAAALNNLGILCRNGNTPEERQKAFRYFNRSANLGWTAGRRNLIMAYITGCGTEVNYKTARRFANSLAMDNDPAAMFILGMMDLYGYGADADPVSAFKWYLKSAKRGHVPAMLQVAEMLRTGNGVKADPAAADQWLQKAKVMAPPEEDPEILTEKDEKDAAK